MESPLRDYLKIVRRQAWLIVLVTVAAVVLTAVIVKLQQPVYRAATTLVVGEPHGELPPVLGSTSVTRTMTTLLESDLVARSVIDELNLDVSKEDFKKDLKVEVLPDTAVLRVAYDSTDQQLALDVVSELAAIFTQRVGETLGVSTTGQSALRSGSFDLIVRVFDAPHVEPAPRPKQTVQKLLIAVPVGLVLGLLLAVARTSLSVRIWERKEAEEWLGAPVVASISKAVRRRLSPASEEELVRPPIEALRTRFQLARMGMSGPIVVVTSAAREGATTAIAANLAIALAQTGKQVVCVDAGDGSGASLASWFHATGEGPGLADVLEGRSQLEEALVPVNVHLPSADGAGSCRPPTDPPRSRP